MKKKRVLVSGCGSIGKRHLRTLYERPDVLLAACDVDERAAGAVREIGADIDYFSGLSAGLEWKPEYVVVASPNRFHANTTIRALAKGAHVLCEKPLADTVRAGKRMVAAAKKHRHLLAVGYTERYRASIQHVEGMIRRKALGNLVGGRALIGTYNTLLCSRTACRDDFGALLVDYTHEFDFLRAFFGEVEDVECFGNRLGKRSLLKVNPSLAVTLLRYESGVVVSVHMDYVQHPQRRSVEVFGDKRSVTLDLQTDTLQIFDANTPGFQTLTFENVRDDRFRAEHQDLFDAVAKKRSPKVDGVGALRVLEVAEKAIRRLRKRTM